MARLGKSKVRVADELDRKDYMELEFEIHVNADGEFTTTLNEADVKIIQNLNVTLRRNHKRSNSRHGYFSDNTKDGLISQINDLLKECMSRSLIEEKIVLRYSIDSTASFCLTLDDKIIPNGAWHRDGDPKPNSWQNGTRDTHASSPDCVGVNLWVIPFNRKVYRYRSGKEKIEYKKVGNHFDREIPAEQYYLAWLTSIVSTKPPRLGTIQEIDYTEERAKFFVEFYKSICKLSNMVAKFEEPDQMMKLIDSGKILMQG